MALLRALRISQNGPKGSIFEAHGNRVRQLTEGKKPLAELVTPEQLQAEAEAKAKAETAVLTPEQLQAEADAKAKAEPKPETKPDAKPNKKGGPKPADALKDEDDL